MKKLFLVSLMMLAIPVFTFAQTTEEQTILKMERDILDAWEKGDAKTLDRMLADDYTESSTWGVYLKKDMMKNLKPLDGISYNISEKNVRVYGNAAIVHGVLEVRIKTPDKGTKLEYERYTNTYIKGKNGWQQAASQYAHTHVWLARKLADGELKPLAPMGCEQESGLKSLNEDVPAYHRVVNSTNQSIKVFWINYEGKRQEKPTVVEAGKTENINTFLTHPFLIVDAGGKCLGIYQPMREPGIVIIK
jgi:hypothetical protein